MLIHPLLDYLVNAPSNQLLQHEMLYYSIFTIQRNQSKYRECVLGLENEIIKEEIVDDSLPKN